MVEGSNPSRPTIKINWLAVIHRINIHGLREFLRGLTANYLRWINLACIEFKWLRVRNRLEPVNIQTNNPMVDGSCRQVRKWSGHDGAPVRHGWTCYQLVVGSTLFGLMLPKRHRLSYADPSSETACEKILSLFTISLPACASSRSDCSSRSRAIW
jgi:hypothetical protein